MATIRDVAAHAGVSIATVSRIISGDPNYKVTEETRSKVWDSALKLNYWPRPAKTKQHSRPAESLKLGCIFSMTLEKYSDPFFTSVLAGAETRLMECNCSISITRTYNELTNQNILFNTFNQQISGILLLEEIPENMLHYIKERVPNIVGVDTYYEEIDNVGFDRRAAAIKAVSFLISKGHRRIGFIGGSGMGASLEDSRRFDGYCYCLRKAGIPLDERLVKNCKWSQDLAQICTRELLSLPKDERPTAIFAASDLTAIAALSVIYEFGLKVPTDIAIIGINNIDITAYTSPPLSTIDVHAKEIGKIAADLLLNRINGDTSMPKSIYLPTKLIVRGSV
ncbi:MAG TPA: LacI family transcriptional regulator [Clostridiaceae bacterium]|nr:LacI family transcriptional regulator [Clostridiaceae bacterium]